MRVKAKTGVFYNGKRYEKEAELDIKKEAMDENLFENLEKDNKPKEVEKPAKEE